MRKIYLFVLCALLSISFSFGQSSMTIDVTSPGTLSQMLGDAKKTIVDLTVRGTINDVDFQVFRQMPLLKDLDLSSVTVANGKIPDNAFSDMSCNEIKLPISTTFIGSEAFRYSNIKKLEIPQNVTEFGIRSFWKAKMGGVDFSKCQNVKTIKDYAFSDVSDNVNLSSFTSLENIGVSCFSGNSGTVILPKHLKSTFPGDFWGFRGRVILPEGIEAIAIRSFTDAIMDELILPSSLKIIEEGAFSGTNIKMLEIPQSVTEFGIRSFWKAKVGGVDFSKCQNVKNIKDYAFSDIRDNLDLSTFTRLENIGVSCFSGNSGTVILPKHLKSTFPGDFWGFRGRVILPEGIETITIRSFANAIMDELILPSSLKIIEEGAFASTSISQLTSLNPIPPKLGNNVFHQLDKNKCVLVVPASSIDLYSNADQWKDFFNVSSYVAPTIPLTFKLRLNVNGYVIDDSQHITHGNVTEGRDNPPAGVPMVKEEELRMETKGTRIGEYYWTDVFDMHVPHFRWWSTNVGSMARFPITQELFDLYLLQCHIDYDRFMPDMNDFNKYYGQYYDAITFDYMYYHGLMYEGDGLDVDLPLPGPGDLIRNLQPIAGPGWDAPYSRDYRQLFGMSPFVAEGNTVLDELDVRAALSYKSGENPLAYDISNGTGYKTYWFDGWNTNMYGFNMMPGGSRLHARNATWTNGLDVHVDYVGNAGLGHLTTRLIKEIVDENGNKYYVEEWLGPKGSFSHMFYSVSYRAKDGVIMIHDRVDTGIQGYFAMPMRWCRKLTADELGYKLFIKVNNMNLTSEEWIQLSGSNEGNQAYLNEIPLLKQVKRGVYSPSDFDIVKINDAKATAPAGYAELPSGYIRGFYVQYFIENPGSGKSIADVVLYASRVDDTALDYAPTKIETKISKLATSVESNSAEAKLRIYPNPVLDILNIESSNTINSVNIFSTMGARLKSFTNVENSIDVSDLTSGTYIIKVETDKGIITDKIIKQ